MYPFTLYLMLKRLNFHNTTIAKRWLVLRETFTIINRRPYIEVQRGLAVLISVNEVGTQSRVQSTGYFQIFATHLKAQSEKP